MQPKSRAQLFAELAVPADIRWRYDPVGWAERRARVEIWSKQREIMQAVVEHPKVAVRSAHSTGKSYTMGLLTCWWLDSHPVGEARVITTAPTSAQVDAVLWNEINQHHRRLELKGHTNKRQWFFGRFLAAQGRKPPDHIEAAFQGFHARHLLVIYDEACHDAETDVLTDHGWVRFANLTGAEQLLTMDPRTQVAEYRAPTRLIKRWHDGEMFEYMARSANFCVTPDHMMYYQTPKGFWHREEIARIAHVNNNRVPCTFTWNAPDVTNFVIPGVDERRYRVRGDITVDGDLWMSFLGWYLSEGSANRYSVQIAQKSEETLAEIETLCRKLGFEPRRYGWQVRINDMRLAAHLGHLGKQPSRYVPDYAKSASARQINLLLDAYVRGDGYQKGRGQVIYTSSRRMADDLQELILKTGVRSVVSERHGAGVRTGSIDGREIYSTSPGYVITRTHVSGKIKLRPDNVRRFHYAGWVYCATVPPHHLLLTRRRGRVVWSGNCGIPKHLWDEGSSLASNEHARQIAIGNPDSDGEFEKICRPGSGWHIIHISYRHTPNFTGESVSPRLAEMLISRDWVEDRRLVWGEESALFQSKCEGNFPTVGSPWQVVPLDWANQCRFLELTAADDVPAEAGVDVGGGNDRTVVTIRQGQVIRHVQWFIDSDPVRTVGHVALLLREWKVQTVKVDSIGLGWGIYGALQMLSTRHNNDELQTVHDASVVPINVGLAPTLGNEHRFLNRRAEMWWDIGRERSRLRKWDFSQLPRDLQSTLIHELTMPQYEILDSRGKVKIEPKEQIIQRLGASPDVAESVLLAFVPANWAAELKTSALLAAPSLLGALSPSDLLTGSSAGAGGGLSGPGGGLYAGGAGNRGPWAAGERSW